MQNWALHILFPSFKRGQQVSWELLMKTKGFLFIDFTVSAFNVVIASLSVGAAFGDTIASPLGTRTEGGLDLMILLLLKKMIESYDESANACKLICILLVCIYLRILIYVYKALLFHLQITLFTLYVFTGPFL